MHLSSIIFTSRLIYLSTPEGFLVICILWVLHSTDAHVVLLLLKGWVRKFHLPLQTNANRQSQETFSGPRGSSISSKIYVICVRQLQQFFTMSFHEEKEMLVTCQEEGILWQKGNVLREMFFSYSFMPCVTFHRECLKNSRWWCYFGIVLFLFYSLHLVWSSFLVTALNTTLQGKKNTLTGLLAPRFLDALNSKHTFPEVRQENQTFFFHERFYHISHPWENPRTVYDQTSMLLLKVITLFLHRKDAVLEIQIQNATVLNSLCTITRMNRAQGGLYND